MGAQLRPEGPTLRLKGQALIFEPIAGAELATVFDEAIELAAQLDTLILFEVNRIPFRVTPDSQRDSLILHWHKARRVIPQHP